MNAAFLIGLVTGAIVVAVFARTHAAVKATAERIDRRPRHTIPGFCQDCNSSSLGRDGRCATCGSNAVWVPVTELTLPTIAPLANKRYGEITRRAIERNERARAGLTTEVLQ